PGRVTEPGEAEQASPRQLDRQPAAIVFIHDRLPRTAPPGHHSMIPGLTRQRYPIPRADRAPTIRAAAGPALGAQPRSRIIAESDLKLVGHAARSMLLCLVKEFGIGNWVFFSAVRNGVLSRLLDCGQDRDGPRGQALMRSRASGSGGGPGAADGSLEGQH